MTGKSCAGGTGRVMLGGPRPALRWAQVGGGSASPHAPRARPTARPNRPTGPRIRLPAPSQSAFFPVNNFAH